MFSSFGFGGSMWNSGPQTSLSILMLLKKKDLCLDELLNDDDILTELKTSNKDLVSFLTKQDTFKQLIDLILVEKNIAEDEPDYKRYCKIPYVACEALTADCPAVITTFVDCCQDSENEEKVPIENKEYKFLSQLFGFLDRKEFNYTSAGYFAKIGTLILEKKPADIIAYLYKKHPESLDKMLNHISSESIADLLIKLMTFESSAITDVANDVYENKLVQVLKLLSQKLETETEQEILKNTAYVISGVFGKSQLMHKGHDILAHVLDSASVEGLFKILKTKNAASISAAVTVLESMFDYYVRLNTPINPINEENKLPEEIDMTPKISSDVPLAAITIEHMNSIVDSIADATDAAAPFGNHRLRLIDFINTALKTHSTEINTAIAKSDFFKVILEMCVRFEWNSILHNQVEKIITITVDTIFDDIKASLFGNGNILSIIVDSFEDSKIRVPIGKRGKTVRKGHLGQFIKIANKIIECTDPIIVGYIEKDQTWKEFVATKMIAINEIRTMKLGEGAGLETAKNAVRKPMVFDMQDEKPVSAAKQQPEHNEQQIDQQDSATASGNKRTLISKRNKTEKNLFHPKRDKYESIFKTRALKNQKKEEPEEEEEQEEPKKPEEPKKLEKVEEPKKIEVPEQKPVTTVTIDLKQAKDEPEVMNKTPTTQNGNKVPGFTSFYSIFNFSPKGLTSIHALLQKPETTINHLLNDENLIKEVKSGNGEVLKFLIKKENFKKLIDHIIVEPNATEQESNFKQCCKLPFVCSEVLSTSSSTIASTLVSYSTLDKEKTSIENREYRYLNQLFSFLDQAELNYTAAGYFAKVVSNLAEKKPFDFLTFLYKRRPEILDNLVKHISLESIADLLLKLLTIESTVIIEIPDCFYETKVIQILKLLSEKLKTLNSPDVTKNAAYVISEVIYKSQGLHKGSEIVESVLDSASIENLFKILKTKDAGSVSATSVVLGNILNYYIQLNTPKELNSEQPIVKATIKHMESIVQLIGDVDKVASLGSFRLKLIDFMSIAIDINNNEVNTEIAKCGFFSVLMKLFLKFEWHNILHAQIEEIIVSVLESNSVNLKISLFEDAKILEIILDVLDEKKTLVPAGKRGKKIRRGYLGHLIRIANKVAECQDADVKKYTESNDPWQDFVRTKLATINEIDNADLGEDKK